MKVEKDISVTNQRVFTLIKHQAAFFISEQNVYNPVQKNFRHKLTKCQSEFGTIILQCKVK